MADSNQIKTYFKTYFEDQHFLVLSKPPGLLSQGESSGDENLVDLLRARFGRNYVGLIHRLDRNTSGLMIVAKRSKSAERLSEQLREGLLVRKYHAILFGSLTGNHHWEHWLLKNEKTNEVKTVPTKTAGAKFCALNLKCIKNFLHFSSPALQETLTLAEFELETGRGHQIRVQSAAMRYPLIGDSKYGTAKSMTLFSRPALHSSFLSFLHPISKEKMTFEERYSADMIESFSTHLV